MPATHSVPDEDPLDGRRTDCGAFSLQIIDQPHAAPFRVFQANCQGMLLHPGWGSEWVVLVDRGSILEPFQTPRMKTPLVLVELRTGDTPLSAGLTDIP